MAAKTLREVLQQRLEAPATLPQLGQTEEASRLLQAKTGQAAGPSPVPARSQQQELAAQQQTIQQSEQQQLQGALAGEELRLAEQNQEQRLDLGLQNIDSKRKETENRYKQQVAGIAADLLAGEKQLDAREYQAKMEQVAQSARLNNKLYLQNLEQAAQEKRLNTSLGFKQAMYQTVFQDDLGLFSNDLSFRAMMDASDRQFNESIQMLSAQDALSVAEASIESAKTQAMWSGVGSLASAGAQAYASGMFDTKVSGSTPDSIDTKPNIAQSALNNSPTIGSDVLESTGKSYSYPNAIKGR
jgi:hypothetical protein